jgi:LysM repeat protein
MHRKMKSYLTTSLIVLIILLATALSPAIAETQENVKYQTGFYYTVQPGDTLWDLSRKFSDTPWQWPEMWQENEQIANPHRIYPGERIRLYRRRAADGYGQTGVGENNKTGGGEDGKTGVGENGKTGGGENGDSGDETSDAQKGHADKGLEDNPELSKFLHYEYTAIDRVGFIRKEPALAYGTVFKVEGQKEMISTDDLIYIRPRPNFSLTPGDKYTLYRTLKPVRTRNTNKFVGIQHYFTGAVEIIIKRPEFVLGKVIGSYRPIRIGDLLLPYKNRVPQVAMNPSPPGLEGSIIESEEHLGIFGENEIAFIDKGRSSGVEPGQFYWIFKQEKYRLNPDKKREVTLTPVVLGELLVLHTENTTATVMITDSRKVIRANDKIITPFKLD